MGSERLEHISTSNTFQKTLKSLWNSPDHKQFSGSSLGVLSAKIFGVLTIFLVQIPLTRLLGAENYGTYVYILSWVTVAGILTSLGMDTVFVKYIPTCVTNRNWAQLKGILTFGLVSTLTASIVLVAAVYVFFDVVDMVNFSLSTYLPAATALLIALTCFQLIRSALRGLELVVLAEILDSIVRPLLVLGFFLFFFFRISVQNAQAVLWANVFAVLLVLVSLSVYLWRHLPAPAKKTRSDFSRRSEWLSLALPMILMAGMNVLLSRTDILMLGSMRGPADAGIYAIGSRFAELATLGLVAINTGLAPRISKMYHSGQLESLQNLLTGTVWFSFAFTVCVAVFLTTLGPLLLSLFGEDFTAAYTPMLVLLAGQTINVVAGSVGYLMIMTGRQKEAVTILFFVVLINIGGNLIFIPAFGMIGAAIATAVSIVLLNTALLLRVVTHTRLNPSIWSTRFQ